MRSKGALDRCLQEVQAAGSDSFVTQVSVLVLCSSLIMLNEAPAAPSAGPREHFRIPA